jgi:hypothetical protein
MRARFAALGYAVRDAVAASITSAAIARARVAAAMS